MFMFAYASIIKICFHVCFVYLMFLFFVFFLLVFKSHNFVLFVVWKLDLDLSFNLGFRDFLCP